MCDITIYIIISNIKNTINIVIRNTELLPELRCLSSNYTILSKNVSVDAIMLCLHFIFGKACSMIEISFYVCLYCDIMFHVSYTKCRV